ncbi:MAG TPA: hypothetical protein VFW02_09860 [Candidatus Limnocylindrales bacterium]|nr:hypothetical protein [Candidatus Limnocylindrales bacterium]
MPTYVIEAYLSREHSDELGAATRRLRFAAGAPPPGEAMVRYVRSVFLPADETCFHFVEAPSADAASELAIRAAIYPDRVLEAEASDGS